MSSSKEKKIAEELSYRKTKSKEASSQKKWGTARNREYFLYAWIQHAGCHERRNKGK
jgi:hypothetical protein